MMVVVCVHDGGLGFFGLFNVFLLQILWLILTVRITTEEYIIGEFSSCRRIPCYHGGAVAVVSSMVMGIVVSLQLNRGVVDGGSRMLSEWKGNTYHKREQ